MPTKKKAFLILHEEINLTLRGLTVRAYSRNNKFLGRVEINRAGLRAKIGRKANKVLGNLSWESLFERLEK